MGSIKNRDFYFASGKIGETGEEEEKDGYKKEETMYSACNEYAQENLAALAQSNFAKDSKDKKRVALFLVKTSKPLSEIFFDNLGKRKRREFSCRSCLHFIITAGQTVAFDSKTKSIKSVMWPGKESPFMKQIPESMQAAILAMKEEVEKSEISKWYDVLPCQTVGTQSSGGFSHFYFKVPENSTKSKFKNQTPSSVREKFEMLSRCMTKYTSAEVLKVKEWLVVHSLPRKEGTDQVLSWLLPILLENEKVKAKENETRKQKWLLWFSAEDVHKGFLHSLCSGLVSILFFSQQDEQEPGGELNEEERRKKYCASAAGEVYQRRIAPPKAGNIKDAEKLFASLGITEKDWKRRMCERKDIFEEEIVWDRPPFSSSSASLPEKDSKIEEKITLVRFLRDVIPISEAIYFRTESPYRRLPFFCFFTGEQNTYGFMQWHTDPDPEPEPVSTSEKEGEGEKEKPKDEKGKEKKRKRQNLICEYTHINGGSFPSGFGLPSNAWIPVLFVVPFPHAWGPKWKEGYFKQWGPGHLFVLENARDQASPNLNIFPETLKDIFHPVKSTIEEYNRTHLMQRSSPGTQEICGIGVTSHVRDLCFLVQTKATKSFKQYIITSYD